MNELIADTRYCSKCNRVHGNFPCKYEWVPIDITQEFLTKLVTELKDIDPKYIKVVDKHFWELA